MSEALADDVRALRAALAGARDHVRVTLELPWKSAEEVLAPLDAERTTGAVVVPIKGLFATAEAATILGLSRPTLVNLIASGEVDNVMVGTHHRIPVEAILAFQRARNLRRNRAAQALAAFSHEMGLVVQRSASSWLTPTSCSPAPWATTSSGAIETHWRTTDPRRDAAQPARRFLARRGRHRPARGTHECLHRVRPRRR